VQNGSKKVSVPKTSSIHPTVSTEHPLVTDRQTDRAIVPRLHSVARMEIDYFPLHCITLHYSVTTVSQFSDHCFFEQLLFVAFWWEIHLIYIEWSDVTESVVTVRSPFCGYNTTKCVKVKGEGLSCYSNKVESLSFRKCPYDRWLTNKAYLSDIAVTKINFVRILPTRWRQKSTGVDMERLLHVRHCHPVYYSNSVNIQHGFPHYALGRIAAVVRCGILL